MNRLPIVAALEALEVGDSRMAAAVLLGALEEIVTPRQRNQTCPCCGAAFEWPGQVADHLRIVHDWAEAA